MTMWENKTLSSNKPARLTTSIEIEGGRNKLVEAKAVFATSSTPKSPSAARQRRRMSFEKELYENGDNSDSEPRKVGSMLSMWENIKEVKRPVINSTEDEALGSTVTGKLKGAKALFENMSKHNNTETSRTKSQKEARSVSPKTAATPVHNVKSLFENKKHEGPTLSPITKRSRKDLVNTKQQSSRNEKNTSIILPKTTSRRTESSDSTSASGVDVVTNHYRSRRTRRRRNVDDDTDSLSSSTSDKTNVQLTEDSNISSRRRRGQIHAEHQHTSDEIKSL